MNRAVFYSIQTSNIDSFWITRIVDGINLYSLERRIPVKKINSSDISAGEHIILIGTDETWLINETQVVNSIGGVPIIVSAAVPKALIGNHSVSFTLDIAMRDAIHYLNALGKQKIALVATNEHSAADKLKRRVFTEENSGLNDSLIFDCAKNGIVDATERFVTRFNSINADAVICANDTAAALLISKLCERGIEVGANFPVLGFGNSHIGKHITPSLTTVDFDYFEMGIASVKLYNYLSKQHSKAQPTISVSLPTRLIIRQSTGNAPFVFDDKHSATNYVYNNVYSGNETETIIMLENYLQNCDSVDCELIFHSYLKYTELADLLFMSERTLKYRMNRILNKLGFSSKDKLSLFIKSIIGLNRLEDKK